MLTQAPSLSLCLPPPSPLTKETVVGKERGGTASGEHKNGTNQEENVNLGMPETAVTDERGSPRAPEEAKPFLDTVPSFTKNLAGTT